MRARDFITEVDRRGFLKGAAAGAITGAAMSPLALKYLDVKKPNVVEPKVIEPEIKKPKNPTTITDKPLEKYLLKEALAAGIVGVELAQLMAQCAVESEYYTRLRERGGPSRFRRLYDLMHSPDRAKDLGNTKPGDGERFYGRGFIQLTGRWNYTKASKAFGIDLVNNPDLLLKPDIAAKASIWFWKFRVRARVSDFYNTAKVTKPINKGLDKLEEREKWFKKYLETMK
jgi:predicted chitinase